MWLWFRAGRRTGYAVWGDLKYPPGFDHFDYVNPQAPKGGELRLVADLRISTFDKYNPFTLKGSAPAYLGDLLFESLLAGAHGRDRPRPMACWPRTSRLPPTACRRPFACAPRPASTTATRCWRPT